MKITRKRLMELAGVVRENSVDRDTIAHYVWGKDELMDKSEDEIERVIDEMEKEWMASKGNYSNVDDYIDEFDENGGIEMFL